MGMGARGWALVVSVLALSSPAGADWRFEFGDGRSSGYDRLYRHADPRANPLYRYADPRFGERRGPPGHFYGRPRVVSRCVVELVPGPWGYTEVTRCRPTRHQPPSGFYFRIQ